MKILCVFGQHNYGIPARGEGYEYSNFLPALRNLGHEVALFDSLSRTTCTDFATLNRALLERVEQFRPDILFCALLGYEIWLETLGLIRKSGVRLLNWGTDDSWKYEQFSHFIAPAFDLWATTAHSAWQAAQRDDIHSIVPSQWGTASANLAEPLPAHECRYPVSFIGAAYGNRPHWIEKLKARGINVACFGHGWKHGPVAAADITEIVRQSVISLNFGDSGIQLRGLRPYRSRQIKARVFEVTGAGGCLLTEAAEHLDSYFALGSEVEVFTHIDELAEKIHFLLAHPDQRDGMAWAGHRRTRSEYTYEARFQPLLAGLSTQESMSPPDMASFEAVAARHRCGLMSRILRKAIAQPCQLVWGPELGPRAARRFLFELSWRLLGRQTYTAAGLPGRLFFRES